MERDVVPLTFSAFMLHLLPVEILALILSKLPTGALLLTVPLVCRAWRRLCQTEGLVWANINMRGLFVSREREMEVLLRLTEKAGPALRSVYLFGIDSESLGRVVISSEGSLEVLAIDHCHDMTDAWAKEYAPWLPGLFCLDAAGCEQLSGKGIKAFGMHCPFLTYLTISPHSISDCKRILRYMPDVRHLYISELHAQEPLLPGLLTILRKSVLLDRLIFRGRNMCFDADRLSERIHREELVQFLKCRRQMLYGPPSPSLTMPVYHIAERDGYLVKELPATTWWTQPRPRTRPRPLIFGGH